MEDKKSFELIKTHKIKVSRGIFEKYRFRDETAEKLTVRKFQEGYLWKKGQRDLIVELALAVVILGLLTNIVVTVFDNYGLLWHLLVLLLVLLIVWGFLEWTGWWNPVFDPFPEIRFPSTTNAILEPSQYQFEAWSDVWKYFSQETGIEKLNKDWRERSSSLINVLHLVLSQEFSYIIDMMEQHKQVTSIEDVEVKLKGDKSVLLGKIIASITLEGSLQSSEGEELVSFKLELLMKEESAKLPNVFLSRQLQGIKEYSSPFEIFVFWFYEMQWEQFWRTLLTGAIGGSST